METKVEELQDLIYDEIIDELNKTEIDIDWEYYLSAEDIDLDSLDDLTENIKKIYKQNDEIFNVEMIYCSNTMNYLSKNDNSLNESLKIAHDMGYEPNNINNELLASLLASKKFISFNNNFPDLSYIAEKYKEKY